MIQIELLRRVMNKVSAEIGDFILFGLFLREDPQDKWDLVISAPWLEEAKLKGLGEFVEKMASIIGEKELLKLSRIVTLSQSDPRLQTILQEVQVDNGLVEMSDKNLFGLPIRQAYILHSKRPIETFSNAA